MLQKFRFLLFYLFSWVIFFDLMRVVFLVYHRDKTNLLSVSEILQTFWYGLKMDVSLASYILLPVCCFVMLSLVIPVFCKKITYIIYTGTLLFLILFISICDLEVYNSWGFRIDPAPLRFLHTPREAFASVSHLPLILFIIIFFLSFSVLLFVFWIIVKKILFRQQVKHRMITAFLVLLLSCSLIIPIRGGLQLAPLNQSSVYFSLNNYANHAAINPTWNYLHSVFSEGVSEKNPYLYLTEQRLKHIVDSLYKSGTTSGQLINFSPATNVVFIIWESFTGKAVHYSVNGAEVLPHFRQLMKDGIYFSNVYASGDRTNKGLPAVLSGYPALPGTAIINFPGKSEKLKVLSQLFKAKGYTTSFFYGGEPEFANLKSYLLHGEFDPIIGKNDFLAKDLNSKWGAHDGVVLNRVFEHLNKSSQPFFTACLTLSSHEPFETPIATAFDGSDIATKFLNSLHYTDQCIGEFIDQCRKQAWWANTVVIITGDHGHRLPETDSKADEFRIPMLWTGGAVLQKGITIEKIFSQTDIAATLCSQAGFEKNIFPFSRNILDSSARQWAFFSFHEGFGFADSSGRIVFDNIGKRIIQKDGKNDMKKIEAGKAMQQYTYDDFLKK